MPISFSFLYATLISDFWLIILWALLCDAFVGGFPVYLPIGLLISLVVCKVKKIWIRFISLTILLWVVSPMSMMPSGWGLALTLFIYGAWSVYGQDIEN